MDGCYVEVDNLAESKFDTIRFSIVRPHSSGSSFRGLFGDISYADTVVL